MKIAFSCVVDAKPRFEWQAFVLVQSLLRNTASHPADIKVHCLPGVTQAFRKVMYKLGVEMIDIQPFNGHSYCNKIQQCFSPVFEAYDKILLLDCDLYFLGLPTMNKDASFSAKIVDLPNPPLEVLDQIFQSAGINGPKQIPVDCALSAGETTYENNFNGGLYIIDQKLLAELGSAWKKQADWLLGQPGLLEQYQQHVDQIAMSMALSQLGIECQPLSSVNNFPVHLSAERLKSLTHAKIKVLHYHHHTLPNGSIKNTGLSEIDRQISQANTGIETILREEFSNELFWSMRYELFPELGSGVGSRGELLSYKQQLLACALDGALAKQVIDIGCGDLELSKVFDFKEYTGFDLSAEALKIAKSRRPDWQFIHGSITDHPGEQADTVICLDVLIHQKTKDEYLELIRALAAATKERLIISGYEDPPAQEFTSDICAYHEPLSRSLSNLGVFNEVLSLGNYRGLSFLVADKQVTGPALHHNDLSVGEFRQIVNYVDRKDLLRSIMDVSRNRLGFYTKTSIRAIEYPWVLDKITGAQPRKVADIGAGVSPLPIILGESGYSITTLDFHPITRDPSSRREWNEWGFLDYSIIIPTISSHNVDVLTYRPTDKFDVIYSVSVIEHMPRKTWEQVIQWVARWLRPGGRFILTLDLVPGSETLWNFSEGKEVEKRSQHGTLDDFRTILKMNNLIEQEFKFVRGIPFSRTDVTLVDCRLTTDKPNFFQQLLNKGSSLIKPTK